VKTRPAKPKGCAHRARKAALRVISTLYVAMQREGWEEGPTMREAVEAAHDWFYEQFGDERGPACEVLGALGRKAG